MGFEGNVLRAAIMGFLLILIKNKFGRIPMKRNVLILTLFLFSLFNPYFIFKDIGTQLSFLAITGIFYLAPLIEKKLKYLPTFFQKTLSETLAAQIFTYPLILYYFGSFNFFSLFSNLFVLPVVPYVDDLSKSVFVLANQISCLVVLAVAEIIFFLSLKFLVVLLIYFNIPLILVFVSYLLILLEVYYQTKNETIDFNFSLS
ncbi:MAG: hypothetical protein KatS3mg093_142 [Candidatus Parcubacteria bacterium]|nr:MAG: hypothetical protein KatS3mg093_142 [Candidatus Parcubacteria bacterium]